MDEVNILRNRTFNDELRSLVDKVSSHERPASAADENLSRNDLVRSFHRLFYELKYLNDYNFSEPDFNPFLADGAKDFSSGFYISEYFKKTGFDEFAVFEYRLDHECFEVSFTSFDKLATSSMVISMSDNLYSEIMSGENGFLLNREDIITDKFLSRKFIKVVEDNESSGLLFMPFSLLTENIRSTLNLGKFTSHSTPVLMLKINSRPGQADLIKIRRDMEKNLSLPLFIFSDRAKEHLTWPSFQNLLYYVNYFQSLYSSGGSGKAYIVSTNKYIHREVLSALKYLFSRFHKTLGSESVIFRITVNRIIIFTVNSMIPALDKIMNEWNALFDNVFMTELKSIKEIGESDIILKDFFA